MSPLFRASKSLFYIKNPELFFSEKFGIIHVLQVFAVVNRYDLLINTAKKQICSSKNWQTLIVHAVFSPAFAGSPSIPVWIAFFIPEYQYLPSFINRHSDDGRRILICNSRTFDRDHITCDKLDILIVKVPGRPEVNRNGFVFLRFYQ